jgi:hypothetical protein
MRKKNFTNQIGVLFDDKIYRKILRITDELEMPLSDFIRGIVQEKLNDIEKEEI